MSGELGSLENRFDRAGNGALAPVLNAQAEAPAPPIRARSARIQERVERMRAPAAAAAQDPQAPAARAPAARVRARARAPEAAAPAARILAALDEVVWALAPRTRRWWPAVVVDPHEFRRDSPSIRRYVRQRGRCPPAWRLVQFVGDRGQIAWVPRRTLLSFGNAVARLKYGPLGRRTRSGRPCRSYRAQDDFVRAVQEADELLRKQQQHPQIPVVQQEGNNQQ